MFKIACGDVMPGCPARFENSDRAGLLTEVATHAEREHGINEITPEVREAIEQSIEVA